MTSSSSLKFSQRTESVKAAADKAPARPSVGWTGQTRGGHFGNWFFVQLIRCLGVRWAYVWLVLVAGYFTFATPRAARTSIEYLERVLGPQRFWRRTWLVYRHFFSYGVTLLDRLAVLVGRGGIQCRCEGEELLAEQLQKGKGIILLGSHLGSWEMGGEMLCGLGKPVNIVILEHERERLRHLYDRASRYDQFRLLSTDQHPLRGVPILAALRRGEIVALHGDRCWGGASLGVPFFGSEVQFPIGPYQLAGLTGAPIFHIFAVRERLGQYRFFSYPPQFVEREMVGRDPELLRPKVREFAERLAAVAQQYPYQWNNFYSFWSAGAASGPVPSHAPTADKAA